MKITTAAAAISALALSASAGLAQTSTWNITTDGIWGLASNWDPAAVPGASNDVILGMAVPYTVTVSNNSYSAGSITISNPSANLHIGGFRTLSLFGDIANQGTIAINPAAINAGTRLVFQESGSISGPGTLRMSSTGTTAELATATGMQITHEPGHTISGYGRITANLVNNGSIEADTNAQILGLFTSPKTNNASIAASNGAFLDISGITVTQGPSGVISATDADTEVRLINATIIGGTLAGQSGGEIASTFNSTLQDVELQGETRIDGFRTLTINGSLENNGSLRVNPASVNAGTSILVTDGAPISGSGEIVLSSGGSTSELRSTGTPSFNHAPDHTIRGYGRLSALITNQGLISADAAGLTLEMTAQDKVNESEIQAVNGAILDLQAHTMTQTPGASIRAIGPSSVVNLAGVTINGGTIGAESGGLINVRLISSVSDVTIEGPVEIEGFRYLDPSGTFTNNGIITVNPLQVGAGTGMRFADGTQLLGNGRIILDANSSLALLATVAPGTMTQGADHTIAGRGRLDADLTNNGLIEADQTGLAMEVFSSTMTNNAEMRAVNGAQLNITNSTINQSPTARLIASGADSVLDLINSTINGGAIQSGSGGVVRVQNSNSTVAGVAIDADLEVFAFRTLNIDAGTTNDGSIEMNPTNIGASASLNFLSGFTLEGDGIVRLSANNSLANISSPGGVLNAALGSGQRLEGIGRIQTPLAIHGTVAPGLGGVGTLNAISPVTLSDTSTFEVEVSGDDVADRFSSSNPFTADGTLDVSFIEGFNPAGIWTATIVSASTVTGEFDNVIAPDSPSPFFTFRVGYFSNSIRIGFVCDADFDLSGELDFFDISRFLMLFNNGQPAADITGDGEYDFFDISAFLQLFTNGCADG
jgi:hypothetical protein